MKRSAWSERYEARKTTVVGALKRIRSGSRVFVGSGCGRPQVLLDALFKLGQRLSDIEIIQGRTLGVVPSAASDQQANFRHHTFHICPGIRDAVQEGRADYTPVASSQLPSLFANGRIPVDVVLLQVSPPDETGYCSMGITVGITRHALTHARYVAAQVNPRMPRTFGNSMLHVDEIHAFVEAEHPLPQLETPTLDDASMLIAYHCVKLIEDGAVLRLGHNAVSAAIARTLIEEQRQDLGLHTEHFTDCMMEMMRAGVVTNQRKQRHRGKSVACRCFGSQRLYEFVHENPQVEIHTVEEVNDPFKIAAEPRMVSIIRVAQVDLTGQVSDESTGGAFYGGFGGRGDFIRGAAASRRGKPIVVLPSTSPDGRTSNIKMFLDPGAGVFSSRAEVHYVVTEYGIAALHGKPIRERAIALINIAHPRFRDELMAAAKQQRYVHQDQMLPPPNSSIYPENMESQTQLGDLDLHLRPARPQDERAVQAFIYQLDDKSIYYRFHGELKAMNHSRVQEYVNVDYADRMTLLAFLGTRSREGELVAMGQYLRYARSNQAEVAFITADAFHNRGVGTTILHSLIRHAREQGIEGCFAEVLLRNKAMVRVFEKAGVPIKLTREEGTWLVEFQI